jgi:hypothetical protein
MLLTKKQKGEVNSFIERPSPQSKGKPFTNKYAQVVMVQMERASKPSLHP